MRRTRPTLSLHPENPHYFLFRGKPTVLITSGEHYGAVLNQDFDYVRYLDTLKSHGLDHPTVAFRFHHLSSLLLHSLMNFARRPSVKSVSSPASMPQSAPDGGERT